MNSGVDQTPNITKVRKCLNLFTIIIGPLRLLSLYLLDIFLDLFNASLNFYPNCHDKYLIPSLTIMVTSYVTSMAYLYFESKEDLKTSILYPFIYG